MATTALKQTEATTERLVRMPIRNPDTNGRSRTFQFAGRVDLVDGGRLVDWKTVDDPARFIDRCTIGYQAECYALALQHEGVEVTGIEYRLVRRPTIQFCRKDKDAAAYRQRCADWLLSCSNATTTHVVYLNRARLSDAEAWLWNVSKRILECRAADRWLMNEGACYRYERECEYLPLCRVFSRGGTILDVMGDYERRQRHHELGLDDVGILTYSSASCLTTCEQMYRYRYELGMRQQREEAPAAASLGSAFHVGMDAALGGRIVDDAIESYVYDNYPAIGEEMTKQREQLIARACAMVVVALWHWVTAKEEP